MWSREVSTREDHDVVDGDAGCEGVADPVVAALAQYVDEVLVEFEEAVALFSGLGV